MENLGPNELDHKLFCKRCCIAVPVFIRTISDRFQTRKEAHCIRCRHLKRSNTFIKEIDHMDIQEAKRLTKTIKWTEDEDGLSGIDEKGNTYRMPLENGKLSGVVSATLRKGTIPSYGSSAEEAIRINFKGHDGFWDEYEKDYDLTPHVSSFL